VLGAVGFRILDVVRILLVNVGGLFEQRDAGAECVAAQDEVGGLNGKSGHNSCEYNGSSDNECGLSSIEVVHNNVLFKRLVGSIIPLVIYASAKNIGPVFRLALYFCCSDWDGC